MENYAVEMLCDVVLHTAGESACYGDVQSLSFSLAVFSVQNNIMLQ